MKHHSHRESFKPTLPPLDQLIGAADDLFVKLATFDPEVGDEMVMLLRDQAPNLERLRRLRSLQLNIKGGVDRNPLGQVAWILFWVSESDTPDVAVYSTFHCFDPHSEKDIAFWRQVADQDHWHLFLVCGNSIQDYYTFQELGFETQLDAIIEHRFPAGGNPLEAERLFRMQPPSKDLLTMAEGLHSHKLVLKRSDLDRLSDEELGDLILNRKQPDKPN